MLVKTSKLQGATLDWAVAKCEGYEYNSESGLLYKFNEPHFFKAYSTDWAQGGPIIERENISVIFHDGFYGIPNTWFAYQNFFFDGMEITTKNDTQGNTPLSAAMRCYVTQKLGNDVEVPDSLI